MTGRAENVRVAARRSALAPERLAESTLEFLAISPRFRILNSQTCVRAVSATAAMSDNGDVNDFGDVVEPEPDVGEDPFGGSDLEPVTDDEDEEDDGEDLLENQEMCAIGPVFYSWHPSRLGHAPRVANPPVRFPERRR
jgi:hypothetical protein